MKTGPLPVPAAVVTKPFWESTWFRVGGLLCAPMLKNLVRVTCGKWLATYFDIDVLTWDRQLVVDILTILIVAGVALFMWLRTNISPRIVGGVFAIVAIYLAFRAGASHWTTVTAIQWAASGLLFSAAVFLWLRRIFLGLSPKEPCVQPIKGTERLGPLVSAFVEKKLGS